MQPSPAGRRPKVLTVDDDVAFSNVLGDALREAGCDVVQAYDGPSGLETARREQPDLITLDLELPVLYGQVILRALKRDRTTAGTPVLVITANPQLLRSDDYPSVVEILCKPFDLEQLVDVVRRIVAGG